MDTTDQSGEGGTPPRGVDLNTAGLEELMSIKGIGRKRAQAIIKQRRTRPLTPRSFKGMTFSLKRERIEQMIRDGEVYFSKPHCDVVCVSSDEEAGEEEMNNDTFANRYLQPKDKARPSLRQELNDEYYGMFPYLSTVDDRPHGLIPLVQTDASGQWPGAGYKAVTQDSVGPCGNPPVYKTNDALQRPCTADKAVARGASKVIKREILRKSPEESSEDKWVTHSGNETPKIDRYGRCESLPRLQPPKPVRFAGRSLRDSNEIRERLSKLEADSKATSETLAEASEERRMTLRVLTEILKTMNAWRAQRIAESAHARTGVVKQISKESRNNPSIPLENVKEPPVEPTSANVSRASNTTRPQYTSNRMTAGILKVPLPPEGASSYPENNQSPESTIVKSSVETRKASWEGLQDVPLARTQDTRVTDPQMEKLLLTIDNNTTGRVYNASNGRDSPGYGEQHNFPRRNSPLITSRANRTTGTTINWQSPPAVHRTGANTELPFHNVGSNYELELRLQRMQQQMTQQMNEQSQQLRNVLNNLQQEIKEQNKTAIGAMQTEGSEEQLFTPLAASSGRERHVQAKGPRTQRRSVRQHPVTERSSSSSGGEEPFVTGNISSVNQSAPLNPTISYNN